MELTEPKEQNDLNDWNEFEIECKKELQYAAESKMRNIENKCGNEKYRLDYSVAGWYQMERWVN